MIKLGCGCDLCQQPIPLVVVQTPDEAAAKQAAYAERRRITAASNGFPTERKPLRGEGS